MRWRGRFEGYGLSAFRYDLISGIIVGIIAIPLGMAFAIASGVKPEYGIYTTIIAGIIISLLGGSKFQIGGPTGAFIPIVFAIVIQYGYENLLIAGFLAGILLVFMGLFRVGGLIEYIPRPVTVGFTAGIAVIIFSGQIANFLGLQDIEKYENFLPNMLEIGRHIATVSPYSVLIAGISLAVILCSMRWLPKLPSSLMALIISTVIAVLFFKDEVATIGSVYGAIPSQLPHFHFPEITWERIQLLIRPALIIAMLGGIESLLSAVVADGMTGGRHNSNRELVGQGIANMVVPLFGGIPATGAIARTAANINSGAVSPFSGVIHGVVVFLVLVIFAPYASLIPLAGMAPILMMVAWNMSERKQFKHIVKSRTSDSIVVMITFGLTVFTNLTIAVEVGLLVSVLLFVKGMGGTLAVTKVTHPAPSLDDRTPAVALADSFPDSDMNRRISLYTIEGPLFFGGVYSFRKPLQDIVDQKPKVLILNMGKVPLMDTTGEAILSRLVQYIGRIGGIVLIAELQPQPLKVMKNTGLYGRVGADRLFEHTSDAMEQAVRHVERMAKSV